MHNKDGPVEDVLESTTRWEKGKEHPQQGFQGPLHRGWDGPQTQPRVSNYWGLWQQATSACLLPPHTSCLDLCCVSLLVQFALDSGIVSHH